MDGVTCPAAIGREELLASDRITRNRFRNIHVTKRFDKCGDLPALVVGQLECAGHFRSPNPFLDDPEHGLIMDSVTQRRARQDSASAALPTGTVATGAETQNDTL